MGYDFDRIINDCRVIDLDHPDVTTPNDDAIFGKAVDIAQLRHNQAQNSSVGWSAQFFPLTTTPGKAEYPVTAADFGKPSRIHTIDPQNKHHYTRKVPVIEVQNVEEYYRGPAQSPIGGTNHHTAVVFKFYYKSGQPFLAPEPIPSDTSVYRVWYETGAIPDPALNSNLPAPDAYHRYLRVSTSIAIISQCAWTRLLGDNPNALDPERVLRIMDAKQRSLLIGPDGRSGLIKQELEFKKQYEDWIATSHQSGVAEANGYADWYLLG